MIPAVLYAPVSSKDQEREDYSIPAQRKLLLEYAQSHGFEIIREFVDVETAKTAGRKQFGEMVRHFRQNKNPPGHGAQLHRELARRSLQGDAPESRTGHISGAPAAGVSQQQDRTHNRG